MKNQTEGPPGNETIVATFYEIIIVNLISTYASRYIENTVNFLATKNLAAIIDKLLFLIQILIFSYHKMGYSLNGNN